MRKTGQEDKFSALKESIDKHGLQNPIHRSKFGIIGGYKRTVVLVGSEPRMLLDKVPHFVEHPEIETKEQYVEAFMDEQPVRMTSSERAWYIETRSKEWKKEGFESGGIVKMLSRATGLSRCQVYRYLPEEVKTEHMSQEESIVSYETNKSKKDISSSNVKTIAKIKSEFDWLTDEDILKGLKDPLYLLSQAKAHFTTVKQSELSKASISELLEVTYTKLEEAGFSKQSDGTMLFWKFLSDEYQKRFSS
jgi:hypothetical protein